MKKHGSFKYGENLPLRWNVVVDPTPNRVHQDKYGQEIFRTLAANMASMLHQLGKIGQFLQASCRKYCLDLKPNEESKIGGHLMILDSWFFCYGIV